MGADEAPFNVLLTTYSLFERDSEEAKMDRAFLKLWRWSCLLLDEAHAVKNRSAKRTTHLNRLSACWPPQVLVSNFKHHVLRLWSCSPAQPSGNQMQMGWFTASHCCKECASVLGIGSG